MRSFFGELRVFVCVHVLRGQHKLSTHQILVLDECGGGILCQDRFEGSIHTNSRKNGGRRAKKINIKVRTQRGTATASKCVHVCVHVCGRVRAQLTALFLMKHCTRESTSPSTGTSHSYTVHSNNKAKRGREPAPFRQHHHSRIKNMLQSVYGHTRLHTR